jgi:hypothetical protein
MAARVEFEDDNGQVVRYVRHANGGGLVSPRARVHEGAMVASTAYSKPVRRSATARGSAQVAGWIST